jgi:hypothetical protein
MTGIRAIVAAMLAALAAFGTAAAQNYPKRVIPHYCNSKKLVEEL